MVAKWMSMKMPQDQLWMERIDFLPNQTVFFIEISLKGTTAQKDKTLAPDVFRLNGSLYIFKLHLFKFIFL